MHKIRWWIFKRLSAFGWWICPPRDRNALMAVMPDFRDAETQRKALEAYDAAAQTRYDLMPKKGEQSTICHGCGEWIAASKAVYFDDESSYCPHHATPLKEPT